MKKKLSLITNIAIVILEIIGLVLVYNSYNKIPIEYYTEDSNILALIISTIFSIYIIGNKKIPSWLKTLKYGMTICLTITLIVVILILAPMYNFNYLYLLFNNELLFHHFLCPILSIITFVLFDEVGSIDKRDTIKGLIFTFLYAFILIFLNIFKLVEGPYPFLKVYSQSIFMSIVWFIVIMGLAYLISYILRKLYTKFNNVI